MRKILSIFIFSLALMSNAQLDNKRVYVGVNYPLAVGDNAFEVVQGGIIDLEAGFDFVALGPVKLGFSTNVMFSEGDPNDLGEPTPFKKSKSTLVQPRFNATLDSKALPKLRPSVGLGYTFQSLSNDLKLGREDMGYDEKPSFDGLNVNLGLRYDVISIIYIKAQYDYIRLSKKQGYVDSDFFRNIGLLKFGIGVRI
ncbi:outer membrane beta-barrel protein [Flagellimonas nanhaiensis]|nr:outer membrane beta-barrel protein [Allomuricauda nanhaiensis]